MTTNFCVNIQRRSMHYNYSPRNDWPNPNIQNQEISILIHRWSYPSSSRCVLLESPNSQRVCLVEGSNSSQYSTSSYKRCSNEIHSSPPFQHAPNFLLTNPKVFCFSPLFHLCTKCQQFAVNSGLHIQQRVRNNAWYTNCCCCVQSKTRYIITNQMCVSPRAIGRIAIANSDGDGNQWWCSFPNIVHGFELMHKSVDWSYAERRHSGVAETRDKA